VRPQQRADVTLDALPGQALQAVIEAVDPQLDANGRSLLVRALIERPGPELKSGMFARARIVFAVRERALMVPEEALVPAGGKQYVIKAVPAPNAAPGNGDGTGPALVSQRLEARLGVRQSGKVEVTEGLAPGDLVVVAGQARVMRGDGVPLRVVDVDKPVSRPAAPSSAAGSSAPVPRNGAPA